MKMIYEKIQSGMDVDVPDLEVRRKKLLVFRTIEI